MKQTHEQHSQCSAKFAPTLCCPADSTHLKLLQAYSPLGTPDSSAMMRRTPDQPVPLVETVVKEVAKRTGKTPAQVLRLKGRGVISFEAADSLCFSNPVCGHTQGRWSHTRQGGHTQGRVVTHKAGWSLTRQGGHTQGSGEGNTRSSVD
jgi:hypothetical protein